MSAGRTLDWVEPLEVAAGLSERDGAVCLLSDGGPGGRFSYVATAPDRVFVGPMGEDAPFELLAGPGLERNVVGLIAYDAGARRATGPRGEVAGGWPDLMLARYPAMLVFDHIERTVTATGSDAAEGWIRDARTPENSTTAIGDFEKEFDDDDYLRKVADVIARIGAGELFQANIARAWGGRLHTGVDPFDVFVRLAQGGAPYGVFWRMGGRALVSNSPELFLTFDPGSRRIETRPIKGTRPRHGDPAQDAASAAELVASEKDRAENLMIVDLMRNDLSRVTRPGSVVVERLFDLESFSTVHHLVSTVAGDANAGVGPAELMAATFPPGSITGAPKHQAMKVIALHEEPRGPWCGSAFLLDDQARLTASVLIRTASFWQEDGRWRFRTLAGAGIVADSVPEAELAETEAKISAIRSAVTGQQSLQPILSTSRGRK